jgi:hypothetical protein
MAETAQHDYVGFPPSVEIKPAVNPEKEKYQRMWTYDQYRKFAPGEAMAMEFMKNASPPKGSEIIDFGAGTGRGALMLAALSGCKVTMLDFASNCLDEDVRNATENQGDMFNFIEHDLLDPVPISAPYGYCTDVMEHIQPEYVDIVLNHILGAAHRVFFQISLEDDACGKLIDEKLHLTVQPMAWWIKKFRQHNAHIMFARQQGQNGIFYVTAAMDGEEFSKTGGINTDVDTLVSNIQTNIAARHRQVEPHIKNDSEVMLLGGGPSLNDFVDDIKAKREAGMPVITTNGNYKWCLDNGITPSAMVVVDARPFNTRFITEIVPTCKYFIASQCHPSMFERVPPEQTWMFHNVASEFASSVLDEAYGDEQWWPVAGGSTVTLRAMVLFRMLGFTKFHMYGFDSCLRDDEHHAYEQEENDGEHVLSVTVADRTFRCHPWMASQAQEFQDQARMMQDEVQLAVYGDGLIAHMINTAAKLDTEA